MKFNPVLFKNQCIVAAQFKKKGWKNECMTGLVLKCFCVVEREDKGQNMNFNEITGQIVAETTGSKS